MPQLADTDGGEISVRTMGDEFGVDPAVSDARATADGRASRRQANGSLPADPFPNLTQAAPELLDGGGKPSSRGST